MRDVVDMPDKKATQFILFVQQNHGRFPKSHRSFFQELTDEEIEALTKIVKENILFPPTPM